MVPGFFENLRDHSEIKLRILGAFLAPWAAKLGSMARHGNRIIWYVDGFAGRGVYKDGNEGSPVIGLRQARQTHLENRGHRLACFFVDKNRNNWRSLEALSAEFRDEGINVRNRHGEFSALVSEIERETQGSPVLLFVDPFGISPLKYDRFRALLQREWPLDIILTFQHNAVHRLVRDHSHLITEAIGTDGWRERWSEFTEPALQTQHILDLFSQKILSDGRFLDVFWYPIRSSINAAPRYYILFASRHYDAFELWNDQVAKEESTLTRKAYENLGQTSFLPMLDEEFQAIDLLNALRNFAHSRDRFTRRELVMNLVRTRWGQYRTGDIKRAVSSLVASRELRRENEPGKKVDDDYMFVDQRT